MTRINPVKECGEDGIGPGGGGFPVQWTWLSGPEWNRAVVDAVEFEIAGRNDCAIGGDYRLCGSGRSTWRIGGVFGENNKSEAAMARHRSDDVSGPLQAAVWAEKTGRVVPESSATGFAGGRRQVAALNCIGKTGQMFVHGDSGSQLPLSGDGIECCHGWTHCIF